MIKEKYYLPIFFFFILLVALLVAFLFNIKKPDVYYYVPPELSFVYDEEKIGEFGFEEYIKERIINERINLVNKKRSFIDIDLKEMKLSLYSEGQLIETFSIQSKGKKGSWWETAPGVYFVGDKIITHFSSISRVWMPYSIQFYGNFFIHGWPYDVYSRPLSLGPSAGCIRLNTEDAKIVFEFSQRGMPILVFDEKEKASLVSLGLSKKTVPSIESGAFMVADLETGEIILSKDIDSEINPGPLVGQIMALSASEIINLERRIIARSWMIDGIEENIITVNRSYRALDLLSPLLLKSSKEASSVLSRFFTPEYFVAAMNAKAKAIGMGNTEFFDVVSESDKNKTTLYDTAKMMRYIHQYRGFLFDISNKLEDKDSVFAVLKMEKDNIQRIIFIGLVEPGMQDFENIILWLNNNLNLNINY